jgi:tetratricopeptide (TPR) repeat protein
MLDWLRLVLMIFYAPVRGIREARDRSSLAPILFFAFVSQLAHVIITQLFIGNRVVLSRFIIPQLLFQSAIWLVALATVVGPLIIIIANIFERRGSLRVAFGQEYVAVVSTLSYVLVATNLGAILIAAFMHYSGVQEAHVANTIQQAPQMRELIRLPPDMNARLAQQLADPRAIADALFRMIKLLLFCIGLVLSVREVFRFSVLRALTVSLIVIVATILVAPIWSLLFSHVIGSPLLLLMLVFLARGYFADFMGQQRAKAAFKQNLEAATLNPADASAHYNLGLIHQHRGELDAARERFERAVHIDAEEVDAHYQLGRIARQQKRFADAIGHFEQVVRRDPAHAQHEIWREVGATYLDAGQYEDARTALEKFLEKRESDPEGLYLMGRAHAGLGHRREAASLMEACIAAVKTAPAYKYRLEKRWLNEAQQFLRSQV